MSKEKPMLLPSLDNFTFFFISRNCHFLQKFSLLFLVSKEIVRINDKPVETSTLADGIKELNKDYFKKIRNCF